MPGFSSAVEQGSGILPYPLPPPSSMISPHSLTTNQLLQHHIYEPYLFIEASLFALFLAHPGSCDTDASLSSLSLSPLSPSLSLFLTPRPSAGTSPPRSHPGRTREPQQQQRQPPAVTPPAAALAAAAAAAAGGRLRQLPGCQARRAVCFLSAAAAAAVVVVVVVPWSLCRT